MSDDMDLLWWVRSAILKHPISVINIMCRLCEVGMAKGKVSANDLDGVTYTDPHVVGATFKLMKRLGFQKSNRIVASTRKGSNSSFILEWDLVDGSKAEVFLSECRRMLVGTQTNRQGQTLLPL